MSRHSLTDSLAAAFSGAKTRLTTALAAPSRFRGALAILVMAIALIPSARLAWNSRDMPLLSAMSDDGIYLVCAKSLAEGSGYRILSLPGQPNQTKYPPLYPWLLSL